MFGREFVTWVQTDKAYVVEGLAPARRVFTRVGSFVMIMLYGVYGGRVRHRCATRRAVARTGDNHVLQRSIRHAKNSNAQLTRV